LPKVTVYPPDSQWLEEFARDIEPDVPVVVVERAARNLSQRRPEAVREVDLEQVPSGPSLQAKTHLGLAGIEPGETRRHLSHEIHRWPYAEPRTDSDHERVVIGAYVLKWIGVDDEERFPIHREAPRHLARHEETEGALKM